MSLGRAVHAVPMCTPCTPGCVWGACCPTGRLCPGAQTELCAYKTLRKSTWCGAPLKCREAHPWGALAETRGSDLLTGCRSPPHPGRLAMGGGWTSLHAACPPFPRGCSAGVGGARLGPPHWKALYHGAPQLCPARGAEIRRERLRTPHRGAPPHPPIYSAGHAQRIGCESTPCWGRKGSHAAVYTDSSPRSRVKVTTGGIYLFWREEWWGVGGRGAPTRGGEGALPVGWGRAGGRGGVGVKPGVAQMARTKSKERGPQVPRSRGRAAPDGSRGALNGGRYWEQEVGHILSGQEDLMGKGGSRRTS